MRIGQEKKGFWHVCVHPTSDWHWESREVPTRLGDNIRGSNKTGPCGPSRTECYVTNSNSFKMTENNNRPLHP